jgi:hypothetical protein
VDQQTVDNIAAVMSPYFDRGSDEWTWEKVLVAVAVTVFGAPREPPSPLRFDIRRKSYSETGTASDAWNKAIIAAGARVRQAENPDKNDYTRANYQSHAQRQALARRIAAIFEKELEDRRLAEVS